MVFPENLQGLADQVRKITRDSNAYEHWQSRILEWGEAETKPEFKVDDDGEEVYVEDRPLLATGASLPYRYTILAALFDASERLNGDKSRLINPFPSMPCTAKPEDRTPEETLQYERFIQCAAYLALQAQICDISEGEVERLSEYLEDIQADLDEMTDVGTPTLSARQYLILQSLLEMGAVAANKRENTEAIATKAEGSLADVNGFKEPIAELKQQGFIETKEGRGGGCWLTTSGKNTAEKL